MTNNEENNNKENLEDKSAEEVAKQKDVTESRPEEAQESLNDEEQPVEETSRAEAEKPQEQEQPQAVEATASLSDTKAQEPADNSAETPEVESKNKLQEQPATASQYDEQYAQFDWDSVGKKQDVYSKNEREKLEQIYDKTLSSIGEHEVIDGTIVAKNNREVVVNIGFKSEGVIPLSEIRYNPDYKVGDPLEVYVESQEDLSGQLLLSHRKARTLRSWERINSAYENDEIIKGQVKSRTKGGLIADVFGIECFLPGSQIDVKPIRDYDAFVSKTMEFKVVKINQEYKNVVVSHKALIEDELEQQKAEIISKLEKGQVLEGSVKNITSYGVFVDLGGVDGLIHITDLSWGRINHPEEMVELDQKIKVVILDFDDEKKRIALGLKQLTPHPWDSLDENLKVGDKIKGKVVVIADYGAFVEIAPGVEGLIHVSEMSWSQHLRTAQDFLKVGDEVDAVILTLDREERKMSLGMKQLIPDPWENIAQKYPVGSKHSATVRNFTNFGIFVELEEGVDGLIHISDLSWSKKIKHPAEFTRIGEQIDVVVLDVDKENRRLSLGHKQLEENPWEVFETVFTVGSVHKGTIVNASDKGVVVSLPYGVEGFAPMRHIKKEDGKNAQIDETLDFKVIEFSKEQKKIIISHSRIHEDAIAEAKAKEQKEKKAQQKQTQKSMKKVKDSVERSTLGDIDVLADLKKDIEKEEKSVNDNRKIKAKKEEEPKTESPKPKEPKAEKPKAEKPKAEKPKAEKPKAEKPKAEKPKAEKPKADKPKAEKPKADKPKAGAAKKKDKPAQEAEPKAKKETQQADEPKAEDANDKEEPKADEKSSGEGEAGNDESKTKE